VSWTSFVPAPSRNLKKYGFRIEAYMIHVTQSKKRKVFSYRHADAKGKMRYSSYAYLTSAVSTGVSDQRHALATLYSPGKDLRYLLSGRLGRPQSWSGQQKLEGTSFACAEDRTLVVKSVVRHCAELLHVIHSLL
jgi:hypothetical protein